MMRQQRWTSWNPAGAPGVCALLLAGAVVLAVCGSVCFAGADERESDMGISRAAWTGSGRPPRR